MWHVLPSVGDKTPQISLSRGVVLSQSTFHLVLYRVVVSGQCWRWIRTTVEVLGRWRRDCRPVGSPASRLTSPAVLPATTPRGSFAPIRDNESTSRYSTSTPPHISDAEYPPPRSPPNQKSRYLFKSNQIKANLFAINSVHNITIHEFAALRLDGQTGDNFALTSAHDN